MCEHHQNWLSNYQAHWESSITLEYIVFQERYKILIRTLQHQQKHNPWLTCILQTALRIVSIYQSLCANPHSIRRVSSSSISNYIVFFQFPPNITKDFQYADPQNHLPPDESPRIKLAKTEGSPDWHLPQLANRINIQVTHKHKSEYQSECKQSDERWPRGKCLAFCSHHCLSLLYSPFLLHPVTSHSSIQLNATCLGLLVIYPQPWQHFLFCCQCLWPPLSLNWREHTKETVPGLLLPSKVFGIWNCVALLSAQYLLVKWINT